MITGYSLLRHSLLALSLYLPLLAYAACNVSATNVAFGTYNPFSGTALDSTGTVTVDCDLLTLTPYTVSLSTGGSGTYTPRTMDSGGNKLQYNLYTDLTRTTIWGNGSGGTGTVSGSALLGTPQNHTVYGRIPASQNPVVGSYTDAITVTVTF